MQAETFGKILFFVVTMVALYFGWQAQKTRRKELTRLAAECGLQYSEQDPFDLPTTLSGIGAFSRGYAQQASNVVHGEWHGRRIIIFDYQYTIGSDRNRAIYRISACVQSVDLSAPKLVIRSETLADKLDAAVGSEDINFESDEFSRAFYVQSDSRKFAYDVCHPRMMSWLLANGREWSIHLINSNLVLTTGTRWSARRFRVAMDLGADFLALVPSFVWQDYAGRDTAPA